MSVLLKYTKKYANADVWALRNTESQQTNTVRIDIFNECKRAGLIYHNTSVDDDEHLVVYKTIEYRDIEAREEHVRLLEEALANLNMTEEEIDIDGVVTEDYVLVVDGVETVI